ncbi:MAG: hypothetical protein R2874_07775 [Desulfobacterales bacterium]
MRVAKSRKNHDAHFPGSRDYETVTVRISPEARQSIEDQVGYELLPVSRISSSILK